MLLEEDRLLSQKELAEALRVSIEQLRLWRNKGIGPAHFRVGHAIRYRKVEVERWLREQERASEAAS